ncbi:MAG: glyoxylate/hydroxypyruvate reductase A [Pseudomonadota bacterium]
MAILLNNHGFHNESWEQALSEYLPGMPIHCYPDIPDRAAIKYAVVWEHPHGDLLNYPNLRAILNLGAGTDHLDAEPELPAAPIVRLLDPDVGNDMAQYVNYWVMHFHRRYEDYREHAARQHWERIEVPRTQHYRVTTLGLGLIGSFIAERVAQNGFKSIGWSRKPRDLVDVDCYSGDEGLSTVLKNTDVLVNCLPLNPATRGFLNKQKLSQLPVGAYFINVSRGAIIDDESLLSLLDSGHIAGAALDAFVTEPLPADSPYWRHKNVFITPHTAGPTYAKSAARVLADNIQRLENGEVPFPIHIPG